jgi:starch phosphorylase
MKEDSNLAEQPFSLKLPERIERLGELANNLWWSWHSPARSLFRAIDYPFWKMTGHNPVKELREVDADALQALAADPAFLHRYDSVCSAFDADISATDNWFSSICPEEPCGPIAYFSAEFAIHNSLPIYAGGLGILAGDLCKEASDLGIPMVGVGFMYPQGYFHQHISDEGWQEEVYHQLNFNEAPITIIRTPEGNRTIARVEFENRTVHIGVWLVRVGRASIYLLDTNVEENLPEDRQLSARLYTADRDQRIQQEIVLGIGGVRVLRALGINPLLWHANEGHTAFMMLERIREEVQKGNTFDRSLQRVQEATIFTTHTPVPSGHDIFAVPLVEKYFHGYWGSLEINRDDFLKLGQSGIAEEQTFNMTVLALKTARQSNAVSQLHRRVTRQMWQPLWPDVPEEDIPITYVTNGVHVPTWIAPELVCLFEKYLGKDWNERQDDGNFWKRVVEIPDEELWSVHQLLKRKLKGAILERAQQIWTEGTVPPEQVLSLGTMLDPEALTIGFVRRFVEYKRPTLIAYDVERLKRIINNPMRPVQVIFAGKSHPADFPSKYILHEAYSLATNREFHGRIAFIQDYDMHMAHYLVQGVDLWLNNPRRLQEACGTSGMKASINGIPQLSIRDGWWYEGYDGSNGWVFSDTVKAPDPKIEDRADAEELYRILEKEIIPLFYERDLGGVPHNWVRIMKQAIGSIMPLFCMRRASKDYAQRMYIPVIRQLMKGALETQK